MNEILSTHQMTEADRLTIEGGVKGYKLMKAAGAAVAEVVHGRYPKRPVVVLCGPGNNGGDGFVAARRLRKLGHKVRVYCLVETVALKGDAALACRDWRGKVEKLERCPDLTRDAVIVDALFGAGFRGMIEWPLSGILSEIGRAYCPVVAVDVPSGLPGDGQDADPHTLFAWETVTFFRRKPAHVLMPGLALCGAVSVADIGIAEKVLTETRITAIENDPKFWKTYLGAWKLKIRGHKYTRGHVLMAGGTVMTGAIRMASRAAMRIGAGVCTVASPYHVMPVYQADAPHILFRPIESLTGFREALEKSRANAVLIGPGLGQDDPKTVRQAVVRTLELKGRTVLDADALNAFKEEPELLYAALHELCVLTPHEGEFRRIFPNVRGSRLERAVKAAELCGCVVLLKGPDTVIAMAGRTPVVNLHASPWLATAGSGDVLAGMIAGLLAQGIMPFEAACAAAWMHGEAGLKCGAGLVAGDLIEILPQVMRDFA